jgi:endonuclease/exonuclease/phosphatase family metal-dependent hydrolase
MTAQRLRILTWNILDGGKDGRLSAIIALSKQVRADVVALQECNGWQELDALVLRRAERELGMRAFPFWNRGGYPPVILTSVNGAYAIAHDDQDSFMQGYQEVVLPLPDGREWHFFNAHLAAFSEEARLHEVRIIARSMRKHRQGLCSLTGDLNALAPGEMYDGIRIHPRTSLSLKEHPALRMKFNFAGLPGLQGFGSARNPNALLQLPFRRRRAVDKVELRTDVYVHLKRQGWVDAFRHQHPFDVAGYTWESSHPEVRLDYAWLSPQLARQLVRCEVLTGPRWIRASDHSPLLWEIAFT